jgi:hypothetical protein
MTIIASFVRRLRTADRGVQRPCRTCQGDIIAASGFYNFLHFIFDDRPTFRGFTFKIENFVARSDAVGAREERTKQRMRS